MMKRIKAWIATETLSPRFLERSNLIALWVWVLGTPFIIIYLKKSIAFLVFISVYAVITGHLSAWQAARVERKEADREE